MASNTDQFEKFIDYYLVVGINVATGEPDIIERYPEKNYDSFPLPEGVALFCLPEGADMKHSALHERTPSFFSFSLTGGDGTRAYGSCLLYYEDGKKAGKKTAKETVKETIKEPGMECSPIVICLISHWPYFSLFKAFLGKVYRTLALKVPLNTEDEKHSLLCPQKSDKVVEKRQEKSYSSLLQSIIHDFVLHTPVPPLGGTLDLKVAKKDFFKYTRQGPNSLPHVDNYCFRVLFQCLSPDNVLTIVASLMLEQKVVVHSVHYGLLTPVCEALCALMFPFTWQHVYIPLIPQKLVDYLQAPVPFFIGMHTSCLASKAGIDSLSSCMIVHLDKDKVVSPIETRKSNGHMADRIPEIPSIPREKASQKLNICAPTPVFRTLLLSDDCESDVAQEHRRHLRRGKRLASFNSIVNAAKYTETEVVFEEGPIGITLESTAYHLRSQGSKVERKLSKDRNLDISAVVKSLHNLSDGTLSPAELSGVIQPGSFLISINGESTLRLSFKETMNRIQGGSRPIRLRFQNSQFPNESAHHFTNRLQSILLLSVFEDASNNDPLEWVTKIRNVFLEIVARLLKDYQRFICIEHKNTSDVAPSTREFSVLVTFDRENFLDNCNPDYHEFLEDFTCTQTFSGFIYDSAFSQINADCHPSQCIDLFNQCIHAVHESNNNEADLHEILNRDTNKEINMSWNLPVEEPIKEEVDEKEEQEVEEVEEEEDASNPEKKRNSIIYDFSSDFPNRRRKSSNQEVSNLLVQEGSISEPLATKSLSFTSSMGANHLNSVKKVEKRISVLSANSKHCINRRNTRQLEMAICNARMVDEGTEKAIWDESNLAVYEKDHLEFLVHEEKVSLFLNENENNPLHSTGPVCDPMELIASPTHCQNDQNDHHDPHRHHHLCILNKDAGKRLTTPEKQETSFSGSIINLIKS